MKKMILIIAGILLSIPSLARVEVPSKIILKYEPRHTEKVCLEYQDFAETILSDKKKGRSADNILRLLGSRTTPFMVDIISTVYESPASFIYHPSANTVLRKYIYNECLINDKLQT